MDILSLYLESHTWTKDDPDVEMSHMFFMLVVWAMSVSQGI